MFDQVATRYDLFNRVVTFGMDTGWRERTARCAPVGRRITAVDVCSGTGELTRAVADRLSDGSCVIGLDFSSGMLSVGMDKGLASNGRVLFVRGRAETMPLPDGAADFVCSGYALRNLEPVMDEFLAELRRILKPGGTIAFLEAGRPTAPLVKQAYRMYLSWVLPIQGRLLVGHRKPYVYLGETIRGFDRPADFRARLETAGFRGVEYRRLFMGIATIYTGSKGN
jgi:demethylmenaquinone methyltransferase/2-methoxy-6-polyprenyl-1,4-benzoquinol methylase